ncbi:microfibril-associated glycoprotein 4-like [Drosophila subpulchrella]|uniref:microfibril-associated glycoprotein 4-like n=1 Tax=Drosophila subpulchrella TaxID=1486046 RepID=UPI0018A12A99|nr:microfibril-associated glycoprotein 4-like [Drosophila subpulchrella]
MVSIMKSIFFVISLSFLLLIELTFCSGDPVPGITKKETPEDLVSVIESLCHLLSTNNEEIADILESLKENDKIISDKDEELEKKDKIIKNLENQIRTISEEQSELTDQLLTLNRTDRCPTDSQSGIYKVKIPGLRNFEAACNKQGWMTIQRRIDGSVNFTRDWESYKNGFGDIRTEFFIGLEKLHLMTEQRPFELKITLVFANGTTTYAHYADFKIGDEASLYELVSLGSFEGTAGDSLYWSTKKKFSTFDRDNDRVSTNCALTHGGGWWFAECGYSSLNGVYSKSGIAPEGNGIHWGTAHGYNYRVSLIATEMMIRPRVF